MHVNKNILIVDDDEDDRSIFREVLQEIDSSIKCMSASNGEEAMHLLQNGQGPHPDIIFLDINMPRMDGKECLIEIKKANQLKHIPVVIYTTASRKEVADEMKRKGAVDFLTKPAEFDKISIGIKEILNKWC